MWNRFKCLLWKRIYYNIDIFASNVLFASDKSQSIPDQSIPDQSMPDQSIPDKF